jgi:hypothetical protein
MKKIAQLAERYMDKDSIKANAVDESVNEEKVVKNVTVLKNTTAEVLNSRGSTEGTYQKKFKKGDVVKGEIIQVNKEEGVKVAPNKSEIIYFRVGDVKISPIKK